MFIPRAFSNSISALLFGALIDLTSAPASVWTACAAASVAALGVWTRPDFALFAVPSGVTLLVELRRRPVALALAGLAFAASCSALSVVDSLYFGRGLVLRTLTPLNSVRYNLDARNLAEHGVHPRWLHAVVNMPLMFGPGAVIAVWAAVVYRWPIRASLVSDRLTVQTRSRTSSCRSLACRWRHIKSRAFSCRSCARSST